MRALFALFIRSVREDSRARLPPLLRIALVVIILLILWANQRSFAYQSAPGREFFAMVMVLNLSFIALASLSIFPSAIAEEKEDDTLALLRMTNLSALSILFGKSTTRLLAVQVPFTLLAITLGGVALKQVWGAYALLGATTFFLCNLALVASVYCRTTMRAGFLTATLAGALYGLLPFVAVVTTRMAGGGPFNFTPVTVWDHIAKASVEGHPMFALFSIVEPRMMGGLTVSIAMPHLVLHLAGGVICFIIAWLIFDRYSTKPEELRRRTPGVKGGRPRRWSRVTRAWCRRPVAWKEFFFTIGGTSGLIVRLALCGAIFATVYGFAMWENNERMTRYGPGYWPDNGQAERMWRDITGAVMVIAGMCAGLEVLLLVGRLFGTEHRRQTLASLVALPWSVGKLIRQKVLGALPILAPWLILATVAFLISPDYWWKEFNDELADMTWRRNREEICVMIYVCLQAMLLVVTVAWFSLRIRHGALPAAIAVLAVWNIAFAVCVDEMNHRNAWMGILAGAMITAPALLFACVGVHRRIQLAAAEE
jgi:hypothetical protein